MEEVKERRGKRLSCTTLIVNPKKKRTKNLQTRVTRPSALPPSNNTHPHLDSGGVDGVQLLPEPPCPANVGLVWRALLASAEDSD